MYTDYLNQPEYRNEILTKDSEVKNTTSHLSQDELIRAKSNITMMLAKVSDQIELLETAVEGHIDYWHDNQVLNDNGDIIGFTIQNGASSNGGAIEGAGVKCYGGNNEGIFLGLKVYTIANMGAYLSNFAIFIPTKVLVDGT